METTHMAVEVLIFVYYSQILCLVRFGIRVSGRGMDGRSLAKIVSSVEVSESSQHTVRGIINECT